MQRFMLKLFIFFIPVIIAAVFHIGCSSSSGGGGTKKDCWWGQVYTESDCNFIAEHYKCSSYNWDRVQSYCFGYSCDECGYLFEGKGSNLLSLHLTQFISNLIKFLPPFRFILNF